MTVLISFVFEMNHGQKLQRWVTRSFVKASLKIFSLLDTFCLSLRNNDNNENNLTFGKQMYKNPTNKI